MSMGDEYRYHIGVEGDWASINPKTLQSKVQIYFQSRKKSRGGDCVIKWTDRSATVYFKSELIRDDVLSKNDHEITIDSQTLKLKVSKPSSDTKGHKEEPNKLTGTIKPELQESETIAKELLDYTQNHGGGMNRLREIHLVDNNPKTVNAMAQAVKKEFADFNPQTTIPQQMGSHGRGASYDGRGNHGDQGRRPESDDPRNRMTYDETPSKRPTPYPRSRTQQEGMHRSKFLQAQSTQEGLKIILREGNIQDALSDVIVNTVSENLDLSQGAVSKALLQAAGPQMQTAAYANLRASKLSYGDMVDTDGYNLNCQRVCHVVCPFWNRGAGSEVKLLKGIIHECLKKAENWKLASISFPAIGTGNLGFPKDLVSQILLSEVHAFSARVRPQFLNEVTVIVDPSDSQNVQCFIKSFRGGGHGPITRGAHAYQQWPGIRRKIDLWGDSTDSAANEGFAIVREEVEPVVFQLCGETEQDLREARELINSIIVKEYVSSSIQNSASNYFSSEQAEGFFRSMVHKTAKENARHLEAFKLSSEIEWQYQDRRGNFVACDILDNYNLENALMTKQCHVTVTINNERYDADTYLEMAIQKNKKIKLKRTELKDQSSDPLSSHWEDMRRNSVLRVPLQTSSSEYTDVEKESEMHRRKEIVPHTRRESRVRVQNETPWTNYRNQKLFLDRNNKHANNERRLFHGTSSTNIDEINNCRFDRSFAGRHGAMYGNGV